MKNKFFSWAKIATIITLALTREGINLFSPTIPIAEAKKGPVKLCNGSVEEEVINAAIMYYSFEKKGWIAQGWYVIQPGKCSLVTHYEGAMFIYGETVSKSRIYAGSGNIGFCGSQADFYGYQKTKCKKNERFLNGIQIEVPKNGAVFRFTFGDFDMGRDEFDN